MQQCGITRLWALRAKFKNALEMVLESEPFMSRLESMLEDLILEAKKIVMPIEIHAQDSNIESQVGSSALVVLIDQVKNSLFETPMVLLKQRVAQSVQD